MRPDETTSRSPLDKPLDQLTEEDISQLTREDCRRYLKEKGMRRPSWNKSQAIQQVLSLKSLLETRSDSGAGNCQAVVSFRPENSSHHIPPVSAAEEHVSYRRKELPKSSFSGNVPARLPSTDNNKAIPPTPTRVTGITNEPVGQMTIFYHGKVNVYDGVPATKAKAIMRLAGSPIYLPQDTPSGVNRAVRPFPCHLQAASDRPGSSSAAASSPTLQATKVAKNTVQYKEEGNVFHEVVSELGVLSWRLDADNYETDEELKKIREARGYSYMDFCEVCPEKLTNYEEKIKSFFEEHLHTDEEIRYCVAGSGYFDVRDRDDRWIRIWVKKGAMIVLPAGIYHHFTLDSSNYIKAMRLFVGDPVWTPYNRPHDHLPAREGYLEAFVKKDFSNQAVDATA